MVLSSGDETGPENASAPFVSQTSVFRTPSSRHSHSRHHRPKHHQRLSSIGLSTDTVPSLPEYERTPPPHPVQTPPPASQTAQWSDDKLQPPPNYPGSSSPTLDRQPAVRSAQPRVDVDSSPTRRKTTRQGGQRRRTRSYSDSGSSSDDTLDLLLKRSVAALETSNALLQASLSTNSNLSLLLSDSTFDRTIESQLKFLEQRLNASEAQDAGMEDILRILSSEGSALVDNDGSGRQNARISRSLPTGGGSMRDHMADSPIGQHNRIDGHSNPSASVPSNHKRRLRLSTEGRPISPPPRPLTQYIDSYATESPSKKNDAASASIIIPSTLGQRSASHVCHLPLTGSPPDHSPIVPSSPHPQPVAPAQPPVPLTQNPSAYNLLFTIHSRTSPRSSQSSHHSRSGSFLSSLTSPLKRELFEAQQQGTSGTRSMESPQIRIQSVTPPPLAPTWAACSSEHRLPSDVGYDARTPIDLTSPPLTSSMSLYTNTAAMRTMESLRKILADSVPPTPSPIALGKQRAEDERPGDRRSPTMHLKAPGLQRITKPSLSPAVAYSVQPPSLSSELTLPEPVLAPSSSSIASSSNSLVVRRSALKTSSGRVSPASSGRSTPRVSFASLPPKHKPDGTKRRPIKKEKTRKPRVSEKPQDASWLTQWLLGPLLVEESRGRPNTLTTRRGAMVREEGNIGRAWSSHGGLESWQV